MVYGEYFVPTAATSATVFGAYSTPSGSGTAPPYYFFECSQSSASFRFLLSYASRFLKDSPAPISGGSRDLVPYNRRTGLRHSGLSCVSVGNHTLTLVCLTQAELRQRVSYAIDMPVVPTLYQLCTLQAVVFS